MNDTPATLPIQYAQAANTLKKMLSGHALAPNSQGQQQLLDNPDVQVSKGFSVQNWNADASKDVMQITIKHAALTNSDTADAVGKMALSALNEIDALKSEAIMTSPKEYLDGVKKQLAELQEEAVKSNVRGSGFDYTKAKIFDPSYSGQQIPDHGVQIIDNPNRISIRINIPTNPDNREEAAATAQRVAENLKQRLPEIKEKMIERILDKNYIPGLTEEGKKNLEGHKFEVTTQQQANWTSVFLDISSPDQQRAQQNPGKTEDPELLKKTNMIMQIPDENSRFKLTARAVLYEGEKLRKPSAIFDDIAGAKDMKNAVGRLMHHLKKARPELAEKIDGLLNEDVFKRHEQWNLPPEKREEFKPVVAANIDPDHPDTMKIILRMPKGRADEVAAKIAGIGYAPSPENASAEQQALGDSIINIGKALENWADRMQTERTSKNNNITPAA